MLQAYDLGARQGEFETLLGRHKAQDAALSRFRQLLARIESHFGDITTGLDALRDDVRALDRQQQDCLPRSAYKTADHRGRFEAARGRALIRA